MRFFLIPQCLFLLLAFIFYTKNNEILIYYMKFLIKQNPTVLILFSIFLHIFMQKIKQFYCRFFHRQSLCFLGILLFKKVVLSKQISLIFFKLYYFYGKNRGFLLKIFPSSSWFSSSSSFSRVKIHSAYEKRSLCNTGNSVDIGERRRRRLPTLAPDQPQALVSCRGIDVRATFLFCSGLS